MEHPGNREGKVNKTDWHIRGSSEEVRRLHTALNRLSEQTAGVLSVRRFASVVQLYALDKLRGRQLPILIRNATRL